jgi:inosine/xanthosine triphosphatase
MKKVVIASKNPVKIQAIKNGFEQMFPDQEFEFIGLSVDSGVSDQPMSSDETFTGAKNRADNASIQDPVADFHIGIEGGIEQSDGEMAAFAWVVIKSNGTYGKSKTGTFYLPKQVVELVNQGKELGEADDIVFDRTNSKQKSGAVGILTGNVIDRTAYYTQAVILSLILFRNEDLY